LFITDKIKERMATTELVYPLAFPKSVAHKCEICGKTASRMCSKCRVTYYCSEEHQTADNVGIHDKICSTLSSLRSKQPFLPSEEERRERDREIRDRKIHLIEMTRMIGERHVKFFRLFFISNFILIRYSKIVLKLQYQQHLLHLN
jgi:hypothetical protein